MVSAVLMGFILWGCGGSAPKNSSSNTPNPSSKVSPAARQKMDRNAEEALRLQELSKVEVENKLSPYRYVTSTERYSIFSQLVQKSTLSRLIHSQGVTLLAPTDDAFGDMPNWKMLLRNGNQQDIDDFVGHHVLPIIMTYDDFKGKETHTTTSGQSISMETRGGIFANDAHVRSGHVSTENGNVIGLDGVLFIPYSLR